MRNKLDDLLRSVKDPVPIDRLVYELGKGFDVSDHAIRERIFLAERCGYVKVENGEVLPV